MKPGTLLKVLDGKIHSADYGDIIRVTTLDRGNYFNFVNLRDGCTGTYHYNEEQFEVISESPKIKRNLPDWW